MYPNLAYQPNAVPFRKQQLSSTVGGKEGVGYMYGAGVWVGRENDNGSQAPTCLHWLSPCPNPGQWTFRHNSRIVGRTLRVRLACERERTCSCRHPPVGATVRPTAPLPVCERTCSCRHLPVGATVRPTAPPLPHRPIEISPSKQTGERGWQGDNAY